MGLESFTPLQKRVFTLDLLEQVEYVLSVNGDLERSFQLEAIEGLHPFSGREKYLAILDGSDEEAAQVMSEVLSDDVNWDKNVLKLLKILRGQLPASIKILDGRLKDAASLS